MSFLLFVLSGGCCKGELEPFPEEVIRRSEVQAAQPSAALQPAEPVQPAADIGVQDNHGPRVEDPALEEQEHRASPTLAVAGPVQAPAPAPAHNRPRMVVRPTPALPQHQPAQPPAQQQQQQQQLCLRQALPYLPYVPHMAAAPGQVPQAQQQPRQASVPQQQPDPTIDRDTEDFIQALLAVKPPASKVVAQVLPAATLAVPVLADGHVHQPAASAPSAPPFDTQAFYTASRSSSCSGGGAASRELWEDDIIAAKKWEETQEEEEEEEDLCAMCWERPKETTLAPCGHRALCVACTETFMAGNGLCPICRGPVKCFIKREYNV